MAKESCTCTFGVSRTCPLHANKKRGPLAAASMSETRPTPETMDNAAFTARLHEIVHGSDDKCAYGGIGCPIRRDLRIEVDRSRVSAPIVAPPNHALVQLLEAALLHPESAEGNIRQVIEALSAAAPIAPVVDENSVAFTAYNQAIEDAKEAIRGESQGGGYWAAAYINAIARRCSPHVYVNRLSPASTVAPQRSKHHKHCSSWTVNTSGERQPCDCVCECTHSMFQHIRPGEHYWYEDCAVDGCPCMKFIAPASPAALRDEADSRLAEIAKRLDFGKAGPTWYGQQEFPLREALTDARYLLIALERLSRATTATPSTLARKAAHEIVQAWLWHTPEHDQLRAQIDIQTIIEQHVSAEQTK